MSGVSSIPPLLCSTPPPMDFGDEEEEDGDSVLPNELSLDDEENSEYIDFEVNTYSNDNKINPDVPSLPGTPVQLNSNELLAKRVNADIPTISNTTTTKTPVKPVEAFNLAISTAMLGSNSPPPLEFDDDVAPDPYFDNHADEEEDFQDFCIAPVIDSEQGSGLEITNEEEDSLKNEDNVSLPSLKFDTLSMSSDKLSGGSPTSPALLHEKNAEQNETKDQRLEITQDESSNPTLYDVSPLPHGVVKMEDILDDTSDDETHSPKRGNNRKTDENAIDFFAIHAINSSCQETNISDTLNKDKPTTETVKGSGINLGITSRIRCSDKVTKEDGDDFDNFTDFTDYKTPVTETVQLSSTMTYQKEEASQAKSIEFDADFGDFVTTTAEHQIKDIEVKPLETLKTSVETFDSLDEDDFEDFQDFSAAPSVQKTESNIKAKAIEGLSQANDTEDEFGNFSEVPFTAASIATTESSTSCHISTAVSGNSLNDKLKSILDVMFPNISQVHASLNAAIPNLNCSAEGSSVCLKLDSIDSAKALDYQWTKSEVRHSLIRSLGIDSRNILFGDKWNSSMPRIAASLTPLEPLKPQQVNQHASNVDAAHSNFKDRGVGKTLKPDVPAVEFDWNSSGLVNPLDGPQEVIHAREAETIHTSQLRTSDASIEQQPSLSIFATSDGSSKLADNVNNNNNNNNTATATSTVINTAATTALSSIISADSISYNVNDDGYNIDLGVSELSENLTTNVGISSFSKTTTTTTDISYNLAATCSNNKDVPDILDDEVVATSTFAGPLKETHIYTPSKTDSAAASATKAATTSIIKTNLPIDFDYEIAAAGIIIDETVVKKEYRDVEYNPGFSLDFNKAQPIDLLTSSDRTAFNDDFFGPLPAEAFEGEDHDCKQSTDDNAKATLAAVAAEIDDEFSDFQSVPPSCFVAASNVTAQNYVQVPQTAATARRTKELDSANNASRTGTPTFGGREMILSPAILLPQAISIESNKPKIEWGDTTANINPEELARIEELFPQPKIDAANNQKSAASMPNGYQQTHKPLSISATIAQKELHVDDDDWSEFVSVPAASEILVKPKPQAQYIAANNNNQFSIHAPSHRHQQRQQQTIPFAAQRTKTDDSTAYSADEEWSDFVSSAPPQHGMQYRAMPQFNSAAWKNANFYNNPLSFYQSQTQTQTQTHSNVVPKHQHHNFHHNNKTSTHLNYNNNYNKYNQQQLQHNQHAQQLQQKIHIMQDFSTAPPSPHRSANAAIVPNHYSSNAQFQVGSAKVAPSISLIPDLGFIAPATATHTAFINTLPKPSLITKK